MAVLLVGLGNPGEKYRETRHNLGWDAMDAICYTYGLPAPSSRFKGRFGSGVVQGEKLYWLLPETFMNLSGESVSEAARYYQIEPKNVIVFHDDMDLALGKIKMKVGGGHGGHNGLKSIQQHLGTADFVRVRLGIGRPPAKWDPANYVLSSFTKEERDVVMPVLMALAKAALGALQAGNLVEAMNRLSRAINPVQPVKEKPAQAPRRPARPPETQTQGAANPSNELSAVAQAFARAQRTD
ncbi:peptidyl-tRNA hydrolase [Magnetococcus marinus MC-1]|uniref:Peptidyl-tRNA hydrolase n=1 Tax=Magnetococcus marinus (strain ATCC BAA-1437 / JCM 17883 / MC-1) TaxID=156889 RepID=A0L5U8_MAGMM|nr:aminoacyl-tRNA hydrolase [Magnetococcus marinus]ABK43341.1 peptidyl-tRNA hydrolase [Magnetococcus marinus MC-1]